jgi:hypothetical protein
MARAGLLACLAAAALHCGGPRERDAGPANLMLITRDTVRADRLGCYGYGRDTTPVLDGLAARGTLFEQAVASSAVTPVSHASILTGLYPYRNRLRSLHGGAGYALPEEQRTLAELLAARGFATAWLDGLSGGPFFAWVHYFDVHDPILLPPAEYLARFEPASASRADRLRAIYDAVAHAGRAASAGSAGGAARRREPRRCSRGQQAAAAPGLQRVDQRSDGV